MDVAELAPLDRAVTQLAIAERDDDRAAGEAAITAVALAWISMDDRERECKLRYFHADRPYGASLRAALTVAATKYDLGMAVSNYADLKGRPWP
jgi:hypothetical protein